MTGYFICGSTRGSRWGHCIVMAESFTHFMAVSRRLGTLGYREVDKWTYRYYIRSADR